MRQKWMPPRNSHGKLSHSKYQPKVNNVKPICSCEDKRCPYEKGTRGTMASVQELIVEKPNITLEL